MERERNNNILTNGGKLWYCLISAFVVIGYFDCNIY